MQTPAVPSSTQAQQALQVAASQLSSGKRTTSTAVDPSADQDASNARDAVDPGSAASGAVATISDAAHQLYTLSATAANGLLSASDRTDLQTEANATTQPLPHGSTPTTSIQTGASDESSAALSLPPSEAGAPATSEASADADGSASNTADAEAISTITGLMHERTKTQLQVALQIEANRALSAVLAIIPR